MRVLFLSAGGNTQDYMRDCVFHGFRSLVGTDVVDVNRLDSMYMGADRSQMYGRGMTLYAELPNDDVDRTDIYNKVRTRYFDLVVFGSIHRSQDLLREVTSMYPPSKVAYIDGEDHPGYLRGLPGHYFKRELLSPQPGVHPIQFAIPASKILPSPPTKSRLMAPMDPIDKSTYIYTTERDYYAQYADSCYAATMHKAGWDCLRHYEILSQWTIPYFRALDACPSTVMTRLPRPELILAQHLHDYGKLSPLSMISVYEGLIERVMDATRRHLTTAALATYILDAIAIPSTKELVTGVSSAD